MTHQTATELDELLACLPMTSIGLLFRQTRLSTESQSFGQWRRIIGPHRLIGLRKCLMYSPLNEYACLEYLTGGTLKGEADFVTAKVKPTGRKYELQCCFVFHFNAQGLIDKVHEYFDMATVDGLHRLPSRRSMER